MPWSTRELADLAGTSLRTVRHYHDIGLLPEPDRRSNGYKAYGVTHLIRVLQIKKLSDLGIGLAQIAEMDGSAERSGDALRALDEELAAGIERQQRIRDEIARLLADPTLLRLAHEPSAAGGDTELTATENDLVAVILGLIDSSGQRAFTELIQNSGRSEVDEAFDALAADSDEVTRERLARRMLRQQRALRSRYAEAPLADDEVRRTTSTVQRTVGAVLAELYNPAQLDVLERVERLASREPET